MEVSYQIRKNTNLNGKIVDSTSSPDWGAISRIRKSTDDAKNANQTKVAKNGNFGKFGKCDKKWTMVCIIIISTRLCISSFSSYLPQTSPGATYL